LIGTLTQLINSFVDLGSNKFDDFWHNAWRNRVLGVCPWFMFDNGGDAVEEIVALEGTSLFFVISKCLLIII